MALDTSLDLLTIPATSLERVPQTAIQDAIRYFAPDLITIPGPRNPSSLAAIQDATTDTPFTYPKLGRNGDHIQQFQYTTKTGLTDATDNLSSESLIDILAVQNQDILPNLQSEIETGARHTNSEGATFLIVPELSVDWDTTTLSTTLPNKTELAAISSALPEPVTVLAGGQPAEYYHEWELRHDGSTVTIPIAGLGATDNDESKFARYSCTAHGTVAAEATDTTAFGLTALNGVGPATAQRLRQTGCRTTADVRDLAVSDLTDLAGIGRQTAEQIHAHADVIHSGDPLVVSNRAPVKTRDDRPPLCLDIETDGLSPTIIWQFGIYDPGTDTHQAFIERNDPTDPESVLEAFITWLLANHGGRTLLTWNGHTFDYQYISQFLRQYRPDYADEWESMWTYDLYKWAVRDGNALLPGRTNKLGHIARALGYDSEATGLTGAQTAAAYQAFMRHPDDPEYEPDWDRHKRYCRDDCEALWYVYQAITDAPRRDMTDSGSSGAAGQQAGLTDF